MYAVVRINSIFRKLDVDPSVELRYLDNETEEELLPGT